MRKGNRINRRALAIQYGEHQRNSKSRVHGCSAVRRPKADCSGHFDTTATGISRRGFLNGLAGKAALASLNLVGTSQARAVSTKPASSGTVLPLGAPLRVKPVLTYQIEKRREKESWRSYGGLQTRQQVNEEAGRIKAELQKLTSQAEFPIEVLPVAISASCSISGTCSAGTA